MARHSPFDSQQVSAHLVLAADPSPLIGITMEESTRQESIHLIPIGRVINDVEYPSDVQWETITSEIVIAPQLVEALDGIDGFSHVVIIFCLHRVDEDRRSLLKVHPENREELPLVGVFATRSPVRPNPIGVTVVKLLERQGNVLEVLGLDAYDGTPVLDIKPYLRGGDLIEEATMPDWLLQLWELQDSGRWSKDTVL